MPSSISCDCHWGRDHYVVTSRSRRTIFLECAAIGSALACRRTIRDLTRSAHSQSGVAIRCADSAAALQRLPFRRDFVFIVHS